MKKITLILGVAALSFASATAVTKAPDGVTYLPDLFGIKISPNGEWVGSFTANTVIYNVKTGQQIEYEGISLGEGPSVANDGTAVGCTGSFSSVIMSEGKVHNPASLIKLGNSCINAITPDGSVITGYCSNSEAIKLGISHVPFIGYVTDPDNIEIVIPDYPHKDFFQGAPVYILGMTLSDDGKTMTGQVTDSRGMYTYPIVFKEESHGVWTYSLPSESLFNTTDMYIPLNPEFNEPVYPEYEDFMTGVNKVEYLQLKDAYLAGSGPEPDPMDYMTDEQKEQYWEAYDFYVTWLENNSQAVKDYFAIYAEVLKTSVTFGHNQSVISPDGSFIAIPGMFDDGGEELPSKLYVFNTDGSGYKAYPLKGGYYPCQVLGDNAVVVTCPPDQNPNTYILPPGGNVFNPVKDVLADYKEITSWIEANFYDFGSVKFSRDMSVACGSEGYYMTINDDNKFGTYILTGMKLSGVEEISADQNFEGTYRVYNLQGVKVLETQDASQVHALPKGLYIVNGKKIIK